MVDDRKLDVLRAIVEDYVATEEPVGSKALVERHGLGVSPATVRNDMAALEEEGYITQPHTSAGRIPTDKGYRLFVDRLGTVKPLSTAEQRAIQTFLSGALDLANRVLTNDLHRIGPGQAQYTLICDPVTGGVLDEITVEATADGYAELVEFADEHATLRAWAIEGTGSYGSGLTTFLLERGEWVVEIDRPSRPARRNGAKSDELDAVRAAREALSREHLAAPRARGDRGRDPAALAAWRRVAEQRRRAVDKDTSPAARSAVEPPVVEAPRPRSSTSTWRCTRRSFR